MIKLSYSYTILFAATVAGVGTAADSTPTAVLWRNGSASGVSVTVSTTAQTGLYKAVFTTDAGWSASDFLELYATATIAGTAGYLAKVWSSTEIGAAELDSSSVTAVQSGLALEATSQSIKAKTDNLPSDPADQSLIIAATDSVMTRLGAPAGASIAADIAAIDGVGGGGDATLAKQEEILTAIQGSAVIQVASPNVSGNLVLTQGDDYDGTANPRASWTVTTDYTTGWTVRFTIRDADDAVVYTTTGIVVSATVVAVTIAAPTVLTMTGCPGQWQGKFDVELTHSSGKKKTIALGVCYINEDQTR